MKANLVSATIIGTCALAAIIGCGAAPTSKGVSQPIAPPVTPVVPPVVPATGPVTVVFGDELAYSAFVTSGIGKANANWYNKAQNSPETTNDMVNRFSKDVIQMTPKPAFVVIVAGMGDIRSAATEGFPLKSDWDDGYYSLPDRTTGQTQNNLFTMAQQAVSAGMQVIVTDIPDNAFPPVTGFGASDVQSYNESMVEGFYALNPPAGEQFIDLTSLWDANPWTSNQGIDANVQVGADALITAIQNIESLTDTSGNKK